MATGGSILEVSIDGRIFTVAADADSNRNLGGFTNEFEANGNGSARQIKTRVPWMVDGLAIEVNDDRGDQEFLQDHQDSSDEFAILVTYVSGISYEGRGNVASDLNASSQSATVPVTLKGPDKLRRQ